ncbi:MAG: hypothetical protein GY950_00390 [bacterium]|nr:hypothetical protein [bacterium]
MKYVVVFRIPGIKKYVFNTDRLAEIRGASTLLSQLNLEEARIFLDDKLHGETLRCVYVGGGIGQFIIAAPADKIDRGLKELAALFARETRGGIRLLYGKSPLDEDEGNYHHALKSAMYDMDLQHDRQAVESCTPVHTGLVRECMSCSGMAVELLSQYDGARILCPVCAQKTGYDNSTAKQDLWKDFNQYLESKGITTKRPADFETIGDKCKAKKGYTALVYADGNGVGKIIDQIKTPDQFEFFSETVDRSIREACYEALYEVYFCSPGTRGTYREMPAVVLMLGGDDLMVYLTADKAFPFAIKAAEKFNEKTKRRFQEYTAGQPFPVEHIAEKGLTISLGIAYGKTHTPFAIMLDQAEELLDNAKRSGSKDLKPGELFAPAYIDYHLSTTFNTINVRDCRENHLETFTNVAKDRVTKDRIRLYSKPYSLPEAKELYKNAQAVVRSGIPNTRLKRLGYAPLLALDNGSLFKSALECKKLYTRAKRGSQRQAVQQALDAFDCFSTMPWKKEPGIYSTVLVDLMELADFCLHHEPVNQGVNHESSY